MGCSVGNDGCVVISHTACEGVVVALYRAGLNVYGVLRGVEHIVLGEDVGVCSRVHAVGGLRVEDVVVHVDVRLTCQRTAGLAVFPIVVVVGQVILKRGVGRADEIGLVVADVVAVGVGEVLTALEVACSVAAALIALCGICNNGCVEGAVMYPTTLYGSGECGVLLLTLHADAILGDVLEGDVSDLEALAEAAGVIRGLTDEVKTPTVN